LIRAKERVDEFKIGWISTVRSSRLPLRGFLRMRNSANAIKVFPHAEERSKSASRSTHDRDAALPASRCGDQG
jgi:hypothetical protein